MKLLFTLPSSMPIGPTMHATLVEHAAQVEHVALETYSLDGDPSLLSPQQFESIALV